MFSHGKALLITLIGVIAMGIVTGNPDCSQDCVTQFNCDIYFEQSVWTLTDGVCKIFHNPCLFASENCSRENKCLRPLKQVSQERCQQKCPKCKGASGSPYCVIFTYTDELGERLDVYADFENKCLADQYACQNSIAYTSEISCF